jgi:photosystem II stability/assembly factor-like uncharacterized protein
MRPAFPPATAFLDANHAWIADGFQTANPGIFRTADGGHTWKHATVPLPSLSGGPLSISELDFIDPRQGWALESLGGAHWSSVSGGTQQNPPTPGAYPRNVEGIHFDSTSSGWTTVVIFAGPQLSGLFHSTDGGHSWRKATLPMTGAFSAGFFGVEPPVFFAAQQGAMIVATQTALGIYTTNDGGKSWTPTAPLMARVLLAAGQPFSSDIVDRAHIWVIADSHLYFTAGLGRHWSLVRQSLGFGAIATVDYVNAQTGWALGGIQDNGGASRSVLRRTADGGHTWTVLQPVGV